MSMNNLKDLRKQYEKLLDVRAKNKAELRKVHDEIETLEQQSKMEERVKAMTDPERKRLAQALSAVGVSTKEEVGVPGAKK